MPNKEFKPESYPQLMRRAWRENRGNWLLTVGLVVSVLASIVGYFDLIPHIEAVDLPNTNVAVSGGNTLIVEISGCASDEGKVVAMLYDGRTFKDSSVPLRMEALEIREGVAIWRVHNLSFGSYAVYAFQDLDNNEVVDPTKERQGVSLNTDTPQGPSGFNYAAAAFDFSPNQKSVAVELR